MKRESGEPKKQREESDPPPLLVLLDDLQRQTGLNDRELGRYLGVDRTAIIQFRAGLDDMPVHAKFAIYDHFGYWKAVGWVVSLLPPKAAAKVEAWHQRHAAWLANQHDDQEG